MRRGLLLTGRLFSAELREDVLASRFIVESWMGHPRVAFYLIKSGSFIAFVREETQNQAFEFRAKSVAVDLREVGVNLTSHEEVIEILFFSRLLEGEDALDNDEKNYANGEQIDLCPFVDLPFLNLRGHVGHCASVRLQTVDALVAGEPEVGNF